ncbi:hypothetical protein BE08_34915 [Sorangium cellulosum]|uniref:Rhamnogalacturonan lyase domain-containing protein n=1 Tax=Sorangium cellulosum TaxID=56 RepID=A0A150PG71_SORCE|nr:hypothetical protein BE08_34915 [Sorangium cellulosum]
MPGAALAAVTIKGRATGMPKLLNPVWNEAKDPKANRYTFREPSPTVRADVRTLVGYAPKELCVAALGEKGAPQKTPRSIVIAGGRTTPVTLVVAEGQQLQFENRDPFPHKIYDVGNKGLQPVEIAAAKTRAWTPPGPGKYEIRDQLAPSIRSWIVVEPRTVAVAYPDRQGNFAIELEAGKYTLQGYFNGEPVGKPLEVVAKPTPDEQFIKEALVVGASGGPSAEAQK